MPMPPVREEEIGGDNSPAACACNHHDAAHKRRSNILGRSVPGEGDSLPNLARVKAGSEARSRKRKPVVILSRSYYVNTIAGSTTISRGQVLQGDELQLQWIVIVGYLHARRILE